VETTNLTPRTSGYRFPHVTRDADPGVVVVATLGLVQVHGSRVVPGCSPSAAAANRFAVHRQNASDQERSHEYGVPVRA